MNFWSLPISGLVKKYSDYIRYPIQMDVEKIPPKEGSEGEYETYTEETTVNSMIPIWRETKARSDRRRLQPFL